MGRLELADIDYIEFVVNNFTQTKNNENVATGADYIISDTSISNATKYIQVGSFDNQTTGTINGNIRLVRKDGNIANTILSNTDITDGTTTNDTINISQKQNTNNRFFVSDQKTTGTKTYTRLIIREVTLNGEKIPFKITSNMI